LESYPALFFFPLVRRNVGAEFFELTE
jgi:hypothetical protein